MPGEALAVASVADLLNTWSKWIVDPTGLASMTREEKLAHFHTALIVAIQNKAWAAADGIYAELKRLSQTT